VLLKTKASHSNLSLAKLSPINTMSLCAFPISFCFFVQFNLVDFFGGIKYYFKLHLHDVCYI